MDFTTQSNADAFDTLFTTNHIRMLKALLPYMDNQMQKNIAVYIKFMELQYTIDFLREHPYPLCGCVPHKQNPDLGNLFSDILPYCSEKERQKMEQLRGIFQSMEMYREMSQTMEMMKEFMPEGDASAPNFDMMNMLMSMLTDEQKEMFQMFNN